MSKLKPLYLYCHYVAGDNIEIPVTIMYSQIQTFETDTMLYTIAAEIEENFEHYFPGRGDHNEYHA